MVIEKIELEHFRNYPFQTIKTGPGINIFYGDNAQGKTNILEAVYLCACARSHRTSKDSELIYHGSDQYRVKLAYSDRNDSKETLEICYQDAVRGNPKRNRAARHVFYNDMKLERVSDMMGLFHAVIFAPEDLMLIKEGPATRRRYLDLLISQVKPSYFIHLQQFARILSQRNMFLKQLREKGQSRQKEMDPDFKIQMAVWDETLAKEGSFLIKQRHIYTNRIEEFAEKAQKNITSGKEKLSVKYKTVSGIDSNKSDEDIYVQYKNRLKRKIYDDIEKGVTSDGPHRDDLILSLDEAEVKPFASQGQQRSAVLALKLSELMILKEETGETPVFLLDDVMSELDEKRRKGLLNNINGAQVFVTCTDKEPLMNEMKWANQVLRTNEEKEIQWSVFNVKEGSVTLNA